MIIQRYSISKPLLRTAASFFLFCLFIVLYAVPAEACTTIIVGNEATADGSIIIARNEDNADASGVQNIVRHLPCGEAGESGSGNPVERAVF